MATAITVIWGALQLYISHRVVDTQFWHLTDKQTQALGAALDKIPSEQRFSFTVRVVFANAQASTLATDLIDVFHHHGWVGVTGGQDTRLRPDLLGINFVIGINWERIDKDEPPHGTELFYILKEAGIKSGAAWEPNFDDNSLQLAIGSRPPDW